MSTTHTIVPPLSARSGDSASLFVMPFFRAPVHILPRDRALFAAQIPPADFLAALRNAPPSLRQNVARVLAAAETAAAAGGTLAFVEGWRHNAVRRPNGHTRRVSGSWISLLLLRMLQSRGLTAFRGPVRRIDGSRCTREEISIAARTAQGRLIGIAHCACPSRRRAAHYLNLAGMEHAAVRTPGRALEEAGHALSPEQEQCMDACRLRAADMALALLFECTNWTVHLASRCLELLRAPSAPPPEILLAHRLRRDQSALTSTCR